MGTSAMNISSNKEKTQRKGCDYFWIELTQGRLPGRGDTKAVLSDDARILGK